MDDDQLLPVLRNRSSPTEFDQAHELSSGQLRTLLEAARWAPSAGNSQPWAFHAALRGTADWAPLVACLAGSSRPWATQASVLIVNISHTRVEDTEWEYSEFSMYDLGQAVAHMTIQAHAMGLACRQFRAFDKEQLTERLQIPAHWEIVTMTAIGRPAPGVARALTSSQREPDITWPKG